MVAGIDINVVSITKKERNIKSVKLANLKQVEKPILSTTQNQVGENFDKQKAGDGPSWTRLAKSTEKDRNRRGLAASPILVRTGALKAAAIDKLKIKTDGPLMTISVGGNAKVKRIAQILSSGTDKIPSRQFLVVTVKLSQNIAQIVEEQQIKEINQALAAD